MKLLLTNDPFWELLDRSGGPDACWPFTGKCNPDGYGKYSPGRTQLPTRSWLAHKVAYYLATGEVVVYPQCVLHRCDNPPCCNPAHLFTGRPADNVADAVAKGRHKNPVLWGDAHPRHKLTDVQVAEVKMAVGTQAKIAQVFGVSRALVGLIRTGKHR